MSSPSGPTFFFTCPHCASVLRAFKACSGRIIRCPECTTRSQVPLHTDQGASPSSAQSSSTPGTLPSGVLQERMRSLSPEPPPLRRPPTRKPATTEITSDGAPLVICCKAKRWMLRVALFMGLTGIGCLLFLRA
jgi:hypothetical protein